MSIEAEIKSAIIKLLPVRYEETNGGYKVVMRNPSVDPDIDQVVDNIKTIYAKYHLRQGV